MKILVITNFYPPDMTGGYELLCNDVVKNLIKRGHKIFILSGYSESFSAKSQPEKINILRKLTLHYETQNPQWTTSLFKTIKDIKVLRTTIANFKPDIVYCWSCWYLSPILLNIIENSNIVYFYHFGYNWLPSLKKTNLLNKWDIFTYRKPKNFIKRYIKTVFIFFFQSIGLVFTPSKLNFKNSFCSCKSLKRELVKYGVEPTNLEILYEGVPTNQFLSGKSIRHNINKNSIKLLYVGRVTKTKGLHTVILALKELKRKGVTDINLTIYGIYNDIEYFQYLQEIINQASLRTQIKFNNPIQEKELVKVFSSHDIFVFPSIWAEPWSRVLLEAMANGMAVIATETGGSKEIIKDGKNALAFKARNYKELAQQIIKLTKNPNLYKTIKRNASREVQQKYDIKLMVDKIESKLKNAILETK